MHPNELKNQALVASSLARLEGFTATADALLELAGACAMEAKELQRRAKGRIQYSGTSTEIRPQIDTFVH